LKADAVYIIEAGSRVPLSACKIQDEILDVSWGLPSARKGSQTDLRAEAKAFPTPVRDNLSFK